MSLSRYGSVFAIAAGGLLSACTTMVEFTSSPPGADVKYLDKVIGKTPFTYGVSDQFGWWSTYTFVASRDGFDGQTMVFPERTPLDAQLVVPSKVQFELKSNVAAAPVAPVVAAAPAPMKAAPAPAPVVDKRIADVEAAVQAWAAAWSRRDLPAYVAAYAPEFSGARASHKAWEKERRSRIVPRKRIEVSLADVSIRIDGDRAFARFQQSYASDILKSTDQKILELGRDASGKWLIRSETVGG